MAACKSIECSSSYGMMITKYDVFVSFRGKDTRFNFTDHLFAALSRKGILTFRDDTNLKKGESIAPELLQAIEASQIFIVIFSKNYASSTWCLRELAKILDCVQLSGKCVLPIFYDVDPSEVRKQSGDYENAFSVHEERFKDDLDKMVEVQRWRGALTRVANLSGWDVRDRPQNAEIEKIVEELISILYPKISSLPNDLVGIESPVEELEKLLHLSSVDDVRVIGISGMGGVGKTTLASVLYERISHQYDACCFIDDVSKIYRDHGPTGAAKRLLGQTLNEEPHQICNLYGAANLIRHRLRNVKAFIVLDNVGQIEELEKLAVNREWLGVGSRIIIISRDEHVLKEYGVDAVYSVQLLNHYNAQKLFCAKAFKCDDIRRDYESLTYDAVRYADGLPLAIKVLGSFLSSRDVSQWRSALARLREHPSKDIMDVLRVSFDGLHDMEKEIFLDIACFLYSEMETYVKKVLDIRGFYPEIGIGVLIDKSLITNKMGIIRMNDLLKELGRNIVREKSPKEPRKWSRLWDYRDLQNVMLKNMAAENLEAIVVDENHGSFHEIQEMTMRADALSKMSHLKLLKLLNVNFSENLSYLSNELGYLSWDKYPFTCLPPRFQPDKLVELILPNSSIKQLWEGIKCLPNLRWMDLSHSENLTKMPHFGQAPNLERLTLEGCIKLVQIDPSIGILRKLADLNLKNCKGLVSIPNKFFGQAPNLERLTLEGCIKLVQIDPSIGILRKLADLNLKNCKSLVSIPNNFFRQAPNLEWLTLEGCVKLVQIDPSIGILRKLADLNLKNCKNLVSIPNNIFHLSSLENLNLYGCSKLFNNQLLEKPRHTENVEKFDINGRSPIKCQSTFSISKILMLPFRVFYPRRHEDSVGLLLPSLPRFPCLRDLDLSFCNLLQIPDAVGRLQGLERLKLGGNNFVTLPSTIKELSKLTYLNLEHCKQLKYLPELPSTVPNYGKTRFCRYEAGLNIFDCPNLSKMENCYNMALSWMIQVLKVYMQSSLPFGEIHIVIPGSGIPRWFNNQNVGSSISMDPSPILHDKYWIGVACCAAFVAHDDPTNLSDTRAHHDFGVLGLGFGNKFVAACVYPRIHFEKDLVTVESDHLLLLFYSRGEFIDYYVNHLSQGSHDLDGIKLVAKIRDQPQGLHVEVRNCGYRWVFEEDLEQLNTRMMHGRNSSVQKRKFLTMDSSNSISATPPLKKF